MKKNSNSKNNFKITEPVILAFEHEKKDMNILKKHRTQKIYIKKKIKFTLSLFFILIIMLSSIYLINWYIDSSKNKKIEDSLKQYISIRFNR